VERRWWEVGGYGCQNDGLDKADMMVRKKQGGREKRREENLKKERGREGGREGVPAVMFPSISSI